MEKTIIHNMTFEQDIASRRAARFFLWLQLGAMFILPSLIALRLHFVAVGAASFMLLLSGSLLLWLYRRYQASPLLNEKRDLQARALQLQEQVAEEQQRLNVTRSRREHLFRKEQFGREATLLNLQTYHIEKGLSAHQIKDGAFPGVELSLKERLAESGIRTALDVTEEVVSRLEGLDAAGRVALMNWQSTLWTQLDATKPVRLPDHQLEYIQKKFQRLHAANDEKEKTAAAYHQQLQAALHVTELQCKQLASITFLSYLAQALAFKGVQPR
jgi:hypothetical protein